MDRAALTSRLAALRQQLARDGVTHLAMYGSRVRGDHHPDSDLDLLIDVEDGRKFSLLDLIGVQHTIADEIGIPVSATMRRSLTPKFREAIAADLVDVF